MSEERIEGQPKYAPGTHVRSKDIRERKITYTWWEPEAQYAFSLGPANSRFLKELKAGKIIGRTCRKCDRVIVPPRMFCDWCYDTTHEWVYLKDTGTVETFSISYLDPDAHLIEDPILVGVISIDGASPKHGFMHYFGEMKPEDLRIGMKVKAVWKPKEERVGSVTDIKYFKPLIGGDE